MSAKRPAKRCATCGGSLANAGHYDTQLHKAASAARRRTLERHLASEAEWRRRHYGR